MAVLWDLVNSRNFNPVGAGLQGYQASRQIMQDRERRSVLADLANMGPDADLNAAALRVMAVDPQTGGTLAQLAGQREDRTLRRETRAEDVAWRQQQAEQARRQWEATHGLARSNADFQRTLATRPDIQMVEQPDGSKVPVLIDRMTGQMRPLNGAGMPAAPANPYAPAGKMTEGQSNAALYATRMAESNGVINQLEGINADVSGRIAGTAEAMTPGFVEPVFNQLASADRQRFMQAKRDFVNAALRRESGAAISPSEFANAEKQYFPQPGDSPQVIEQKRRNRETAIKGIMGAAGPSYRPPETFRPGGRQQPQQQQQFQDGMTATNPQTGQKIMFRGGQWVPVQ